MATYTVSTNDAQEAVLQAFAASVGKTTAEVVEEAWQGNLTNLMANARAAEDAAVVAALADPVKRDAIKAAAGL